MSFNLLLLLLHFSSLYLLFISSIALVINIFVIVVGLLLCVARCVGTILYHVLGSVGCGWLYAYSYRSKLRGLFSLPESPCSDLLIHCCCCVCGISQEYRELKNRGLDPSIGIKTRITSPLVQLIFLNSMYYIILYFIYVTTTWLKQQNSPGNLNRPFFSNQQNYFLFCFATIN